jgi:hypothetical protein
MSNEYRKELSKHVIHNILRQAMIKKHSLLTWHSGSEFAKTTAECKIFHLDSYTQKVIMQLENKTLDHFKTKMNDPLFFRGLEDAIIFKALNFQQLDHKRLIIPIPEILMLEEKRSDTRFKVKFDNGHKVTFTREDRNFSNKSKSIDLPFFDISKSGMAFKIPASLSRFFYEKDIIKMIYLNNVRMLEPAIGEILYISKCKKFEYADQSEFRIGIKFEKRLNDIDFDNMMNEVKDREFDKVS